MCISKYSNNMGVSAVLLLSCCLVFSVVYGAEIKNDTKQVNEMGPKLQLFVKAEEIEEKSTGDDIFSVVYGAEIKNDTKQVNEMGPKLQLFVKAEEIEEKSTGDDNLPTVFSVFDKFGNINEYPTDNPDVGTYFESNGNKFENLEEHPCSRTPPPKPEFKPYTSISVKKCEEYKWMAQKNQIKAECNAALGITDVKEEPSEYVHVGAIGWKDVRGYWIFRCGATLISHKYALTAAHCGHPHPEADQSDPRPKIIRFSDQTLTHPRDNELRPTDRKIKGFRFSNTYYTSYGYEYRTGLPIRYYDIALAHLHKRMRFDTRIHPACLWNRDMTNLITDPTVIGWTRFATNSSEQNYEQGEKLTVGTMKIINETECNQLLQPFNKKSNYWLGLQGQICAIGEGEVNMCKGDSGGPLQMQIYPKNKYRGGLYYVMGVMSFGFTCGKQNLPDIFTDILFEDFLNWIERVVWNRNY